MRYGPIITSGQLEVDEIHAVRFCGDGMAWLMQHGEGDTMTFQFVDTDAMRLEIIKAMVGGSDITKFWIVRHWWRSCKGLRRRESTEHNWHPFVVNEPGHMEELGRFIETGKLREATDEV